MIFSFFKREAAHLRLGRQGEEIAKNALEEAKMEFLCRNYRCRHGELDLIFREAGVLCVVEVKTRHYAEGFIPADAVNHKKRINIIKSTACYLKEIGHPEIPVRYDIVEVIFRGNTPVEVSHIPDAFRASELKIRR